MEWWKYYKIAEIEICVIFECESDDSSMVRMMIGLASWVLGRIFGTGEREAERIVTAFVCWQQIVLGGLDKGWEGKGVGELWDSCWEI